MNKTKKIISLILILAIALLCFTACGSSAKPQENGSEAGESQKSEVIAPVISPELKDFLDSYESFMDEYCEFMKNYNAADTTKMMEYLQILQKYSDFAEKADAWKDKELSDAETAYYLEVLNRVNTKLLQVVK